MTYSREYLDCFKRSTGNHPIMLIFGHQAMQAYHRYMGKLKAGEFHAHAAPKITDVVSGEDVEE